MEKQLLVMIDSGDTLVDESTEIRDAEDNVCFARLIPGAKETLKALRAKGYPVILVADGTRASFECVHKMNEIYDLFTHRVYSEEVAVCKPDARMFDTAFSHMGLDRTAAYRTIMVGNNLERDINGANRLGITSVLLTWSPSRPHTSDIPDQQPTYRIANITELVALCDELEAKLEKGNRQGGDTTCYF